MYKRKPHRNCIYASFNYVKPSLREALYTLQSMYVCVCVCVCVPNYINMCLFGNYFVSFQTFR